MKSSKHVETCFVRANNDFDDKLTAFWMKKKIGQKSPKTDTVIGGLKYFIWLPTFFVNNFSGKKLQFDKHTM